MRKKVIAAGHICLDITPVFGNKKAEQMQEILAPGKLVNVEAADVHTGGSVANTGLAMKLLGADVTLMGKVGDDAFGEMIQGILKSYDAGQGLLVSQGESTSYSVILAIPGIDRMFLHHCGANNTFCAEDIPGEALKDTALFHFGYPPLMESMYENGGSELVKILKLAKDHGACTSLDFASIDPASKAGKADWKEILKRVIPLVDFLVPSVEELCYMLDKERYLDWQKRAAGRDITEILDINKDVKPLADRCMDAGSRILLIKCGASGMYYRTGEEASLAGICERLAMNPKEWAGKEGFEKSYIPRVVLSGTGAGDTSIAAFLTAALRGYSLENAMHLAAAAGASCVEAYDALSGLTCFEKLEERIRAGWKKYE